MSVMPYATVVGVFRDRSAAELAMDALVNAGFTRERMRCLVADTAGGFFDNLKSVFTGLSPAEESLVSNLTAMGLSSEEAQYFSDEYERGSAILAIKTQGDEEMALNVLYQYGAHNAKERARFGGILAPQNHPSASTWSNDYVVPVYPDAVSPDVVPPQTDEAHSTQDFQQDEATASSNINVSLHPTQPTSFGFNPQAYSIETTPRADSTLSPEAGSAESFSQPATDDPVTPFPQEESTSNPDAPLPEEIASDPDTPLPTPVSNDPATPFPPEESASNLNTPFPQETASDPTTPFPEEVPNTSSAPFPEETDETPASQMNQATPEMEGMDDMDDVSTPVYRDEQIYPLSPDVVEIDEIEVSETPVEQVEADVYPQAQSEVSETPVEQVETDAYPQEQVETDDEAQSAELMTSPEAVTETFEEQNQETPTPQTQGEDVYDHSDELDGLLAQIETTRQQLQEARTHLKIAKERESQLTTARLQLKELQAELQATQAELQETRQRTIG